MQFSYNYIFCVTKIVSSVTSSVRLILRPLRGVRSVCEEDLDKLKVWTANRFILKQLDYLLSISMGNYWLGLIILN